MKRGEIYYIAPRETVGSEVKKARPAVVVSNDALNATSGVVEVVYLTTQPKKEMPTHVCIRSTGVQSTVLCENIDHVSKLLVGDFLGRCTPEEMMSIDDALLVSLGLDRTKDTDVAQEAEYEMNRLHDRLTKAQEERDRYARIIDRLLGGSKE